MDCEVCRKPFDDEERLPRNLSCGYSLCDSCIINSLDNGQLNCPFCQKVHTVAASSDVPTSYTLLKLLKILTEIKSSALKAAMEPELHAGICTEHGSFKLFWCAKCHVWVCRDCTVVDHSSSSCKVIPIKQAIVTVKQEDVELVEQAQNSRADHTKLLNNYLEDIHIHDKIILEQIEAFQKLIDEQKRVKHLLGQEQNRIRSCVSDGHEYLKNMVQASNELGKAEAVDDITSCIYSSKQSRDEFKSWMTSSQELLSESDTIDITRELHQDFSLILKAADYIRNSSIPSAIVPFIDFMQKISSDKLILDDLHFLMHMGPIWIVDSTKSRAAPLTWVQDKNHFVLKALRMVVPPSNATILPFESVRSLASSPEQVFMDLSWNGQLQGTITITMDKENPESPGKRSFLRRCTGEHKHSFVNSMMVDILEKHSHTNRDRLCGGGDGRTEKVTETDVLTKTEHMLGLVTLAHSGSNTCFCIWYKNRQIKTGRHSHSLYGIPAEEYSYPYPETLGHISRAIDIILKAVNVPDITNVVISDCGLIITSTINQQ